MHVRTSPLLGFQEPPSIPLNAAMAPEENIYLLQPKEKTAQSRFPDGEIIIRRKWRSKVSACQETRQGILASLGCNVAGKCGQYTFKTCLLSSMEYLVRITASRKQPLSAYAAYSISGEVQGQEHQHRLVMKRFWKLFWDTYSLVKDVENFWKRRSPECSERQGK